MLLQYLVFSHWQSKIKNIQFNTKSNREKQQIFTPEKLESAKVCFSYRINDFIQQSDISFCLFFLMDFVNQLIFLFLVPNHVVLLIFVTAVR